MKKSACIIVGGAIFALAVFFTINHNKTKARSKSSGSVAFEYQPQLTINRSAKK